MDDRKGIAIFLAAALCLMAVSAVADAKNRLDPENLLKMETPIRINEVVTDSRSLPEDRDGTHQDWIELYNSGKEAIRLEGYGLSDEPSVPLKWTFPNRVLAPGAYLVVFASDKETGGGELHTGFKLNRSGDKLSLSDPEGHLLQTLLLAESVPDMAYGLDENGQYVYWTQGTPGERNNGTLIDDVGVYRKGCEITASHSAGFYQEEFDLTLSVDGEDLEIHYTLDGSTPTVASPQYDSPIPIDARTHDLYLYAGKQVSFAQPFAPAQRSVFKGTVLSMQAFHGETPIGKPEIRTFFVDPKGAARYSLPVVSLVTDSMNLFDNATGIFVVGSVFQESAPEVPDGGTPANYNQRGRAWERAVHLEFFEKDGKTTFEQNLGMRTFGAWSRAEPKKSLKLYARDAYEPGKETMDHALLPGLVDAGGSPVESFRQLVLRNGGNDWNTTLFRDPLMQSLADDVKDKQASRPVIVFLNGEYWGIYYLTESLDADWVSSHYGVDAEEIGIIVNGWELYEGDDADLTDYQGMMAFTESHDFSVDADFAQLSEMLDVEAYLRYQAAQIYFGNVDWPGNNLKMWRIRPQTDAEKSATADADETAAVPESVAAETQAEKPSGNPFADGRWRPMLYDTDFGFGLYGDLSDYTHDTLAFVMDPIGKDWPNPPWSTLLFRKMMDNATCRTRFVEIMTEALETRYSTEVVKKRIRTFQKELEPEMAEYASRYQLWRISSVEQWRDEGIRDLLKYAEKRPGYVRMQLKQFISGHR